jgi:hypothetical protein
VIVTFEDWIRLEIPVHVLQFRIRSTIALNFVESHGAAIVFPLQVCVVKASAQLSLITQGAPGFAPAPVPTGIVCVGVKLDTA